MCQGSLGAACDRIMAMPFRTVFAIAVFLVTTTAQAQPGVPDEEVPPQPEPARVPPPEPVMAPRPEPVLAPKPESVMAPKPVSPASKAEFEAANAALLDNRFDEAIALFGELAASSHNQELRNECQALANFAKRLKQSQARIVVGADARRDLIAAPDKESGRTNLVITTTLAAFYSSFALVDVLGVDSFTPVTVTVAVTTAAGLGASLYATRESKIPVAQSNAYSSGLGFGVANGLLFAPKLGIDADGGPDDGEINQNYLLFGLSTMAAGGAGAYLLASEYRPTEGQVTVTSMGGVSGAASAGLALAIIQPDSIEGETVALVIALGMDAGLAGGALLGHNIDWSASRANYVALSQFLGALAGFTVGAVVVGEPDGETDAKVYAGLVLGGIWGGLLGGIHLTRDMDPDASLVSDKDTPMQLTPLVGEDLRGLAFGGQF